MSEKKSCEYCGNAHGNKRLYESFFVEVFIANGLMFLSRGGDYGVRISDQVDAAHYCPHCGEKLGGDRE